VAEEPVVADVLAVIATDHEDGVVPDAGLDERGPQFGEVFVGVRELAQVEPAQCRELLAGEVVVVDIVGPWCLPDRVRLLVVDPVREIRVRVVAGRIVGDVWLDVVEKEEEGPVAGALREPACHALGRSGRAVVAEGLEQLRVEQVRQVGQWIPRCEPVPRHLDLLAERIRPEDRPHVGLRLDVLPAALKACEPAVEVELVGDPRVVGEPDRLVALVGETLRKGPERVSERRMVPVCPVPGRIGSGEQGGVGRDRPRRGTERVREPGTPAA
jgi:hypothetical protein